MILSHIARFLPVFLYPVGMSGALGVAAAVVALRKKPRAAAALAFTAVGVLWFFSSPFVCWALVRALESKFDPSPVLPKVPAIVLLGGCTKPAVPPRTHVEVSCAGDRIMHAARLYKQGYAPVIIATGGKIPFLYDFPGSEGACMASILMNDCGVDSSAIIVEDKAKDTHDHAPRVEAILLAHGMTKEIILVTSAMHMYRSVKVFRKRGYMVHPSPADFVADARFQWNLFAILPRGEALFASTNALHEYYGIIAYKLLGWI
jgi:uncharacterized SAM-binding protein YcdF (DUF218 family)